MSFLLPAVRPQAYPTHALSRGSHRDWENQFGLVEEKWIKLPEGLFSSIMAREPIVNPMYKVSKHLSDEWLKNALRMDNNTATIWSRLDIAFMSAICAPTADLETLKLMNDWNGWIFAFDDRFDNGPFANNLDKAREEIKKARSVLDDVHPTVSPDDDPLRHTLQSCWIRFKGRSSVTMQCRWKNYLELYFHGLLRQLELQSRASIPSIKEYMDIRAGSVGACPVMGFMELAEGLDLPDEVMANPAMKAISRITCDIVTLQNDLCSYTKDMMLGEENNIIFILKEQGMTDQQAVDQVGTILYDCYHRWHAALGDLPFRGECIDRDVFKFIDGCRNIALGNLHWSFKTFRYFGIDGPEVKRVRMFKLP
ncbi:terpene synthase metal protein [Fusarium langsethiae]|uniref:Terpene synthase n=1 Tax=Fusarium langsethiae TaxID=179993 RepID=A0A0M9EY59_FUSLA|nr:terpene synthase metal protein [Fusarium langsethiae]